MTEALRTRPARNEAPESTATYSWSALGVLIAAYILAFADRQVLNLLVAPIKRDLHLSDVGRAAAR